MRHPTFGISKHKKMNTAIEHYQNKLAYEMDPSDLFAALEANEQVFVIDARKNFAYERERIPGAINLPTPRYERRVPRPASIKKTLHYLLRWHRLQCLNPGRVKYGETWL
jgi:hypothetical protein